MPLCVLNTNLSEDAIAEDVEGKMASFLAEQLTKPPERVMVFVRAGQRGILGGTARPFVMCEVSAVDCLGKDDEKKRHGDAIKNFLSDNLNVPKDRVAIMLKNLSRSDVF